MIDKGFYKVYIFGERLLPGLSLKIERNISCNDKMANISELVVLPSSVLEQRRLNSVSLEKALHEQILSIVSKWEEQAALTQLLDKALEYQKAPVSEHSSNQWEKNGAGHNSISNMTYQMIWHVYEKTVYNREAGKSVPAEWHVTWNVYTNPPSIDRRGSSILRIAGQHGKVFKDKAAAEKYINGRIAAYSHLFTELSPPVPQEYSGAFKLNGMLLPGYTVAEDTAEKTMQPGPERESVLDKLREGKKTIPPHEPKTKSHKKDGPER